MQINIFDKPIYVENNIFFKDKDFENSLESLFYRCNQKIDKHQVGKANTTVTLSEPENFIKLKNSKKLFDLLVPKIINSSTIFGFTNVTGLQLNRVWFNKMYTGCKGRSHNHNKECDIVLIYYYNSPKKSGNLYFINSNEWGLLVEDIPKQSKYKIVSETGTLVIHTPDMFHAISEHKNKDPRVVLVMEIKFVTKV